MGSARAGVERIADLPGWTSGVAATASGRVFVSAPVVDQPGEVPTVAEIVDGAGRPLPAGTGASLTSVQGLRAAGEQLFALDTGVHALTGIDVDAAALWIIDVAAERVVRRIGFDPEAVRDTYLNDLAVDVDRGLAFIQGACAGGTTALIRLDLDSGHAIRFLEGSPTQRPAEPAFGDVMVGGTSIGRPPLGVTGVSMAASNDLVAWARCESVFTAPVDAFDPTVGVLPEEAITTWPGKTFASDGLDQDTNGDVLLTDLAGSGVQRLELGSGEYRSVVSDPGIDWPDGVAAAPDGSILMTSSQIHRSTLFQDEDRRTPPFGVFRAQEHGG